MRQLIGRIEHFFWAEISAVIFALCFVALVIWVYWPSRKKEYLEDAQIPFKDESN